MAYSGKYRPKDPKKYVGNPTRIYYRSLWERKFMVYCDTNDSIIEWGSEEVIIPYISPWDGRVHRYFPDFYIKVRQTDGKLKKFIIEIKPKNQCAPPTKTPKRKTKKWYGEVKRWYGANLMHGNLINTSGKSRVSVDFRIIKKSDFISGKKTLTKKIPFEIGGYWEKV